MCGFCIRVIVCMFSISVYRNCIFVYVCCLEEVWFLRGEEGLKNLCECLDDIVVLVLKFLIFIKINISDLIVLYGRLYMNFCKEVIKCEILI